MGDRSAFFYGTLMAPQVLHRVLYGTTTPTPDQTSSLTIQPALLPRYIRHRVRNCDYPAIIPSLGPDACVRGTFVNGISAEDQWRLDLFEGAQYDRLAVKVRLLEGDEVAEGREVEAETYVWCEGGDGLEDGEWDFEEFMKEKMGRWVGNDKEYEEVDEAVRERKDPTGGRGPNGHIGGKLELRHKGDGVLESAV